MPEFVLLVELFVHLGQFYMKRSIPPAGSAFGRHSGL